MVLSSAVALADDEQDSYTAYERQRRVELLTEHIADEIDAGPRPYSGIVIGSLSLAGAGVMTGMAIGWDGFDDWQRAGAGIVAGGAALTAAGAFSSYAFPDPYQATVLRSSIDLGRGMSHTGLALMFPDTHAKVFAIASAAYFSRGLLHVASAATSEPASRALLADDHALLIDRGHDLSPASIHRIEQNFERTVPALSPWLLHSPLMLGGAANMALMAEPGIDHGAMALRGVLGGAMFVEGLAFAIFESFENYDDYEDELEDEGLQVSVAPGPGAGLALNGRF